jgi:hypothetical protein
MPDVLARGSNFRGLLRALEHKHGRGTIDEILNQLPPDLRDSLRYGHVISVGWYPVGWYAALYEGVGQVIGGLPESAMDLSFVSTREDFSTIHRVAIALLSPDMLVSHANRLLSFYWKGGDVKSLGAGKGYAEVRFTGWHGFTAALWYDLLGGVNGVLASCRANKVNWSIESGGSDRSSHMTVQYSWEA